MLRTELSARTKTIAATTYAFSLLTYSFGIIKWTYTQLRNLDMKTRTMFTEHRCYHPRSAIDRILLPRSFCGKGVSTKYNANYRQIENLRKYYVNKQQESWIDGEIVKMNNKLLASASRSVLSTVGKGPK